MVGLAVIAALALGAMLVGGAAIWAWDKGRDSGTASVLANVLSGACIIAAVLAMVYLVPTNYG
jgi:hypothetical protein